jgi:hypothetical protein
MAAAHLRMAAFFEFALGHTRRFGRLTCRLALHEQVMHERRFPPPWRVEESAEA